MMTHARTDSKTTSDRSRSKNTDEREGCSEVSGRTASGEGMLRAAGPAVTIDAPTELQPKLSISDPDDRSEREADRVAEVVMRMADSNIGDIGPINAAPPRIQRTCPRCQRRYRRDKSLNCETCERALYRREENSASSSDGSESAWQISSLTDTGRPLPESVRRFFEPRLQEDFSDVRIHTGSQADKAARSVDAEAFTLGSHVVFRSNAYRPNTWDGQQLLAHELTHVAQQTDGREARVQRQETSSEPQTSDDTFQRYPITSDNGEVLLNTGLRVLDALAVDIPQILVLTDRLRIFDAEGTLVESLALRGNFRMSSGAYVIDPPANVVLGTRDGEFAVKSIGFEYQGKDVLHFHDWLEISAEREKELFETPQLLLVSPAQPVEKKPERKKAEGEGRREAPARSRQKEGEEKSGTVVTAFLRDLSQIFSQMKLFGNLAHLVKGMMLGARAKLDKDDAQRLAEKVESIYYYQLAHPVAWTMGLSYGIWDTIKSIAQIPGAIKKGIEMLGLMLNEIPAETMEQLGRVAGKQQAQRIVDLSKAEEAEFSRRLARIIGALVGEILLEIIATKGLGTAVKGISNVLEKLPDSTLRRLKAIVGDIKARNLDETSDGRQPEEGRSTASRRETEGDRESEGADISRAGRRWTEAPSIDKLGRERYIMELIENEEIPDVDFSEEKGLHNPVKGDRPLEIGPDGAVNYADTGARCRRCDPAYYFDETTSRWKKKPDRLLPEERKSGGARHGDVEEVGEKAKPETIDRELYGKLHERQKEWLKDIGIRDEELLSNLDKTDIDLFRSTLQEFVGSEGRAASGLRKVVKAYLRGSPNDKKGARFVMEVAQDIKRGRADVSKENFIFERPHSTVGGDTSRVADIEVKSVTYEIKSWMRSSFRSGRKTIRQQMSRDISRMGDPSKVRWVFDKQKIGMSKAKLEEKITEIITSQEFPARGTPNLDRWLENLETIIQIK